MPAFTFTVTRTGDLSTASTVDWVVTGSGANPADASDFDGGVLPSGTLNFAIDDVTAVITVNVAADATFEQDEGFTVTISNASPSGVMTTATADGTIQNDDPAPPAEETTQAGRFVQPWMRKARKRRRKYLRYLEEETLEQLEQRIAKVLQGLPLPARAAVAQAAEEQVEKRVKAEAYEDHLTGKLEAVGVAFDATMLPILADIRSAVLDMQIADALARQAFAEKKAAERREADRKIREAIALEIAAERERARQAAADAAELAELTEILAVWEEAKEYLTLRASR